MNFGKLKYTEKEGGDTVVHSFSEVRERDYFAYLRSISDSGYTKKEEYSLGTSSIAIFEKSGDMIHTVYFPEIREARVVIEPNSAYLSFSDSKRAARVTPLMTQIDLEDFGTSVVFRLPDGRFIIYDGGREFLPDADKLVKCLREQSPDEVPVVAAWIMTHPHGDHYRCFVTAYETYPDAFTVERFIYNFTDTEETDLERIPKLSKEVDWLLRFEKCVKATGAAVYRAHTGQVYEFSGARLEMLSTPDDTLVTPVNDINSLSIVVKMTIAGQVIMMCADAFLASMNLAGRYGEYLKSDILEPPHHMFVGGDIKAYDFIDPKVCVVPSFEDDVYGRISPYQNICKRENLHLFYNLDIEDFFTGSTGNVVLELPYRPRKNGKKLYLDKLEKYRRSMGSESWFFVDLTREDCEFTFVNTTVEEAVVTVDLYAEEISGYIHEIKFTVPGVRTRKLNILDLSKVDGDALFHNAHSLLKKGVADGAVFTAHIKSTLPIVVKGKKPADHRY